MADIELNGTTAINAIVAALPSKNLTVTDLTATGDVLIPDGNADGEALAHSQAGAVLNGLTSTGEVVASSTVGALIDNGDATGGGVQLYPYADGRSSIRMSPDDGGASWDTMVIFEPAQYRYRWGNSNSLDLTAAASVRVPAATAATYAAQVSAIDSVTGRLAIGGFEMGTTPGLRDVSSLLINGWTGQVILRREGNTVTVMIEALDPTNATNSRFMNDIAGFRTPGTVNLRFALHTLYSVMNRGWSTSAGFHAAASGTDAFYGSFSTPTEFAWPTSLPGTAV